MIRFFCFYFSLRISIEFMSIGLWLDGCLLCVAFVPYNINPSENFACRDIHIFEIEKHKSRFDLKRSVMRMEIMKPKFDSLVSWFKCRSTATCTVWSLQKFIGAFSITKSIFIVVELCHLAQTHLIFDYFAIE